MYTLLFSDNQKHGSGFCGEWLLGLCQQDKFNYLEIISTKTIQSIFHQIMQLLVQAVKSALAAI